MQNVEALSSPPLSVHGYCWQQRSVMMTMTMSVGKQQTHCDHSTAEAVRAMNEPALLHHHEHSEYQQHCLTLKAMQRLDG